MDWAEDDFLALEVTYRMLRSIKTVETPNEWETDTIDVDAIQKRLERFQDRSWNDSVDEGSNKFKCHRHT